MNRVVFVKCLLSRGVFPAEAAFRVAAPGGGEYLGAVHLGYCYTRGRKAVSPAHLDRPLDGLVVGLTITPISDDGVTRVHLPDGELYDLSRDAFEPARGANGEGETG